MDHYKFIHFIAETVNDILNDENEDKDKYIHPYLVYIFN
jgi:hypothetical protein